MTHAGSAADERIRRIRSRIREVPDYPKPGVLFRDIAPLLGDPAVFSEAVDAMAAPFADAGVEVLAAIESRGFLFGTPLAARFGVGLVPLRKPGKLPGPVVSETYRLEYGEAALEVQADAVRPGGRVLVVDDVLATGGTARAADRLLRRIGAEVVGFCFLVELAALDGRDRLRPSGAPVRAALRLD